MREKGNSFFRPPTIELKTAVLIIMESPPKILVVDLFSQKLQTAVFNVTKEDSIKTFGKIQKSFLRYT